MSQAIFEAPPTQTESRLQFGMPTALELHRLELLRAASHHLPSIPPSNPWACLAFRQISHRLIGWDQLYPERTGQEHIFQNYFEESRLGPELLYAIYPRTILHWNSVPTLSDTIIFSNLDQHPNHPAGKIEKVGDCQSNETSSSSDGSDSSIINSDDAHEDEGQEPLINVSVARPSLILQPMIQLPVMNYSFQLESHSQPAAITHQPTSSSSSNSRYRKSHLIESSFDGMIDFKRRKIQPA
ncbi:uncharacterized protein PGTG_00205 [Puccinia graminis f. sp. tritici CRL 75-36-700-3]|uniref:Uncharacterized protein n=1 Tax=Puccinia graminis f. sp. tritici (strain CRL 75-36-700-3 / race SCCL) TaxID=418459 RepID=E3JRG0_PUCGT|nr:uncharacterized protein PGTG_00205 [Puccinia graminis f. sp. tritici CRL 75-36-700-3]EFP74249.2 hypothetical protein PGTG_00205 [Puccinia graminis f. sp. tritici CRL 75-36-700-3]